MKTKILTYIIPIFACFGLNIGSCHRQNLVALANPAEKNRDIREECRATVSGRYVKILSSLEGSSGFIVVVRTKLERSEKSLLESEKKLEQALKDRKRSPYDLSLEQRVTALKDHLNLLRSNIQAQKKLLLQYRKQRQEAEKAKQAYLKDIEPVFKVVKNPSNAVAKIRLEYKHVCGRFEFLCPLPKDQADALSGLLADRTPLACKRYAQVQPLPLPGLNKH